MQHIATLKSEIKNVKYEIDAPFRMHLQEVETCRKFLVKVVVKRFFRDASADSVTWQIYHVRLAFHHSHLKTDMGFGEWARYCNLTLRVYG